MNKLFAFAAALVVSAVTASALAQGTKPAEPPIQPPATQPPTTQPETKPETKPEAKPETKPGDTKPADAKKTEDRVYVQLSTSMGDLVIELDNAKAPISTENFLGYVEKGAYDGTIFHRVIKGFMIQGGGFDATMKERDKGKGIKNEWKNGLSNKRGTIAMARLGNQPDSGSNQFFINTKDNAFLDQPRDGAGVRRLRPCRVRHGRHRPDRGRQDRDQGLSRRRAGRGGDDQERQEALRRRGRQARSGGGQARRAGEEVTDCGLLNPVWIA
jgi:cyclophilin family peptidyl-prolyl cis-trans isomerase